MVIDMKGSETVLNDQTSNTCEICFDFLILFLLTRCYVSLFATIHTVS